MFTINTGHQKQCIRTCRLNSFKIATDKVRKKIGIQPHYTLQISKKIGNYQS